MKQTSKDSTLVSPRLAKQTFSGLINSSSPIIAARICRAYMYLSGGVDLKSSITIDPNASYLFVSNHQSQLDPFAVFGSLPLRENIKVAPVKFMTAKTVYYSSIRPLLKSMGCYPTRGSREQIIAESVEYLCDGYNVFMFPEGKRTLQSTSQPRPGVSDLIKQASSKLDIKMILVHIDWERKRFGRRHVTISMAYAEAELYQKEATEIMTALYKV